MNPIPSDVFARRLREERKRLGINETKNMHHHAAIVDQLVTQQTATEAKTPTERYQPPHSV